MEWNHPEALWLILPLSGLWVGLALYARARRRRAAAAFVAAVLWPRVLPPESGERFWLKTALWLLALVLGMAALAGPRFGKHFEPVKPRGSDIYVLMDVSKSMLADDVPPSRLGRAKADVAVLLQHLHGERIALLAFAGKAVVKCPLTTDYNYFRTALDESSPASAPRGGTAIGDAIRKALELLPREGDRDQTMLLITDGEDHESYPLKAAEAAAEKRVAIFTVGLGDAEKGARIPLGTAGAKSFVEYKGEQVLSKLDSALLADIALKTSGVYVPAGTKAYDLGQLYEDHLKGRHAADAKEQRRERLSEQYQLFLALALACLLLELLVRPYPAPAQAEAPAAPATAPARRRGAALGAGTAIVLLALLPFGNAAAGEKANGDGTSEKAAATTPLADARGSEKGSPRKAVSEGLALYAKDEFGEAREKFAQAAEQFRKSDDALQAEIAAFDAACAAQRKGDTEKARESYLDAGLARDKQLAAEAHYNLGCMAAENARTLAGEHPEELAPDKRPPVVEKLKEAALYLRNCLELQPAHAGARRNIELVRQWIKYYADKWRELDRRRMRQESNLLEFLDYLAKTQRALREQVKDLKPSSPLDYFAEGKRAQDELAEEIEPLKKKITDDLMPPAELPNQAQQNTPPPGQPPKPDPKQIAEALKVLHEWADASGKQMKTASGHLGGRRPAPAADAQKAAADELDKIWEAVAPFRVLLTRGLAEQTGIAHALKPDTGDEEKKDEAKAQKEPAKKPDEKAAEAAQPKPKPGMSAQPQLSSSGEETAELADLQEQTARRTFLLKLKAEEELKRAEQTPAPQAPQQPATQTPPPGPANPQPGDKKQPQQPGAMDPEKVKAGYRKAIELAPKAVEKMNSAATSLRAKKAEAAYPDAEEARKILEEIEKAQPKDENKEQEKKDQEKKDQDKQKQEDQKKAEQNKQDEKKEQEQRQMSQDQIEAALRKVREREKQKHERDEELKARLLRGQAGVEKDW